MDPATSASVSTELAKQGPLGILALLLVGAIIILWRKLNERDAMIAALQESRLQSIQKVTEKTTEVLTTTAATMANQTETIRELENSLRSMIDRRGR